MINQQLAEVSNLTIVLAITLYVLALFGFGADITLISQRRGDARLEARDREHERELVGVGVPSAAEAPAAASADPTGSSSLPTDPVADNAPAGHLAAAAAGRDQSESGVSDERQGMTPRRFAFTMAVVACVLHTSGVVMRGVATQRAPWANMYEFAMTSAAGVMLVFLLFAARRREARSLGLFVVAPMLLVMLLAQTLWIVPAAALTPSLRNSHWLYIHISVAVAATALSILGAVIASLQLVQARHERALLAGTPTHWGRVGHVLDRLPSSRQLESLSFRIHAIGFVCWTFTLIFGAIWAREAWGRFWGWDAKEVWTFVIWILYAAYLHARNTAFFRGSRAAWIALIGFVAVIFNYTVVNTVINGFHSYSGL